MGRVPLIVHPHLSLGKGSIRSAPARSDALLMILLMDDVVFPSWAMAGLWGSVAVGGYYLKIPQRTVALVGGILAMLVDTMIPEAFSKTYNLTGLVTVLGFITLFSLSKLG